MRALYSLLRCIPESHVIRLQTPVYSSQLYRTRNYSVEKADLCFATTAIHAGYNRSEWTTKPIISPIVTSTIFEYNGVESTQNEFIYTRFGNPTRTFLEKTICLLEEGEHALCFPSGLSAVSSVVNLLTTGDHIICSREIYGGTHKSLVKQAPQKGMEITFVNTWDPVNVKNAMKSNTKLVLMETPTNPTLKMTDIRAVSDIVAKYPPAILVVDNTFMTPYFQKPLKLGADISLLSITKFTNGHGDVMMGAVTTRRKDLYDRLKFSQDSVGMVPSSFDCHLVSRSLKTLHIRMREHAKNALSVAQFLEKHPYVEKVIYPGLPSYPQRELADRQCSGFSGMVSFYIRGGQPEVEKLISCLRIISHSGSLGLPESLICYPDTVTHASFSTDQKLQLGITKNLLRMSVGLEDVKDLLSDLEQAFQKTFLKK